MGTQVKDVPETEDPVSSPDNLEKEMTEVCRKIAPVWPLESFITVNPYHGRIDDDFITVAERLRKVAGARTTMPVNYYLEKYDEGFITSQDLNEALQEHDSSYESVEDFLQRLRNSDWEDSYQPVVPTVADVARYVTDRDWSEIVVEQVSDWTATYFDKGQSLWPYSLSDKPLFAAWLEESSIDRTPDVLGLDGFRQTIKTLPEDPLKAATETLIGLGIPKQGLELYLERLLHRVGGWAAYARKFDFEKELEGQEDSRLLEFLSVQLAWELALYESLPVEDFESAWEEAKLDLRKLAQSEAIHPQIATEVILQDAYDKAEQKDLQQKFEAGDTKLNNSKNPQIQSAFCIDVRSEVFRRHFEEKGSGVQTFGFPGFFGVPIEYYPLAHESGRKQCPPLLTADYEINETHDDPSTHEEAQEERHLTHQVKRSWKAFKWGAISCFSFVGPLGMAYLPKLFTDAFGWSRTVPDPKTEGLPSEKVEGLKPALNHDENTGDWGIPESDRVDVAEDALRALSLTEDFAPLVMITGHGSTTVNNPYDAGYDCGACGGYSGSANAYVAATILNNPDVRMELQERGIDIPEETVFLAALHNTTTDDVTILNEEAVPSNHEGLLEQVKRWLDEAGRTTRKERSERFSFPENESVDGSIEQRSRDWSQVRPEWGLAGCNSFIVAPRSRTENLDLEGRSFLHNYDWRKDDDFEVLELIMTAPMVVTSWIGLQYYASTVDNDVFGSGNKTLHNVVGKMGIFEGNGGDLRVGLPWQAVHDGEKYQHKPSRIKVVIEAPHEAMNEIIQGHETVRHLCENGWIQLFSLDDSGTIAHRYDEDGTWISV